MSTRTNYQLSHLCQGHFTSCPSCLDPEGDCEGHGAISYCDGTCQEARWQLRELILRGTNEQPTPSRATIALGVTDCREGGERIVRFEGPDAEAWAIAYRQARVSTHVIFELPEEPISYDAFPALYAVLHPQCHHGLSADLCMDPIGEHHFGTREWEMAQGW